MLTTQEIEKIKADAENKFPIRKDNKTYKKIDGWLQQAYISGATVEREKALLPRLL